MLEIALAQNDQPEIAREAAWSHGKEGEWDFLNLQALAAAQHGRYGAASELFQQAYDSAIGGGLLEKANDILIDQASAYFELGMSGAGRDVLRLSASKQSINPRAAYLRAELNDETRIASSRVAYSVAKEALLASDSPRLRARLALNQRKPLQALGELQTVDDAEPSNVRMHI